MTVLALQAFMKSFFKWAVIILPVLEVIHVVWACVWPYWCGYHRMMDPYESELGIGVVHLGVLFVLTMVWAVCLFRKKERLWATGGEVQAMTGFRSRVLIGSSRLI